MIESNIYIYVQYCLKVLGQIFILLFSKAALYSLKVIANAFIMLQKMM